MNAGSIVVLGVIVVIVAAVILKATVFKGPRWMREGKRDGRK